MAVQLVFETFSIGSWPIGPDQIQIGSSQVISMPVKTASYIRQISIVSRTAQVTLSGFPAANASGVQSNADTTVDALVAGSTLPTNFTVSSIPFAVLGFNPGGSVTLGGGNASYPNFQVSAISPELTAEA
jgi:hypothetical protein